MTRTLNIVGVVLVLVGSLWALQGVGIVGGSFMTGAQQWLVIGIVTGIVGLAILFWANLKPS